MINKKCLLFSLLILLMCSCTSCCYVQYAKGVQEDALRISKINRSTFYASGFIGVIRDKTIRVSGHKHYLSIDFIDEEATTHSINRDIYCFPYFNVSDSTLFILVSKELYNQLSKSDTVVKKPGSIFIIANGAKLPLLNPNQEIWLP